MAAAGVAAMDWSELFGMTLSPWELVVRGSAMYLFLFVLFRVVVKRRVGSIGMADILILVIVADAAQNGMSGEYRSVTEAFILVGTLAVAPPAPRAGVRDRAAEQAAGTRRYPPRRSRQGLHGARRAGHRAEEKIFAVSDWRVFQ